MRLSVTFAVSLCCLSTTAVSQTFTTQVLETGLSSPTGIAVTPGGDLYFTEVPTPGTGGTTSQNTVRVRDGQTGTISMIAMNEPEPVNLAILGNDVYWTCRTAGVIVRRQNGTNAVWQMGLSSPSGIAPAPNGDLVITQIPTPGMAAGSNSVKSVPATKRACSADSVAAAGPCAARPGCRCFQTSRWVWRKPRSCR